MLYRRSIDACDDKNAYVGMGSWAALDSAGTRSPIRPTKSVLGLVSQGAIDEDERWSKLKMRFTVFIVLSVAVAAVLADSDR